MTCCISRMNSMNLSAAEKVAANDDIMVEIMIRLPVQSVITGKRVSKHMHSLLNSTWFLEKFHDAPRKNLSGMIFENPYYLGEETMFLPLHGTDNATPRDAFTLDFSPRDKAVYISQSCNGLFLLCSSKRISSPETKLYVCNPATRESVQVAHPGFSLLGLGLAFDPTRCLEYRLVAIWKSYNSYRAEVYSSSADHSFWRRARGEELQVEGTDTLTTFYDGVYLKGAVYWLEHFFLPSLDEPNEFLVSFDLDEESLKPLELPRMRAVSADHKSRFLYFGSCCDHLQIIEEIKAENMPFHFVAFEMNGGSSEWRVKYIIYFDDIPSVLVEDDFKILSVVLGETNNERALIIALHGVVIHYDANSKTSRRLWCYTGQDDPFRIRWRRAFQYFETLYPVQAFNDSD